MVGNVTQESIIDQIFCTDSSLESEFKINNPLGKSDHVSIIVDLNLSQPDRSHCYDIYDVKRNWAKIRIQDILNMSYDINWDFSNNLGDMDTFINNWPYRSFFKFEL